MFKTKLFFPNLPPPPPIHPVNLPLLPPSYSTNDVGFNNNYHKWKKQKGLLLTNYFILSSNLYKINSEILASFIYLFICLFVYLFVWLVGCLLAGLLACLIVYLFIRYSHSWYLSPHLVLVKLYVPWII